MMSELPASNITDPLPRPILRAAGMSGAVLAEGAVCLLSGAGGAAKSTLATTFGPGRGLWRGTGRPRQGRRDGQGVLRSVRGAAGTRDDGQLRGTRRKS